MSSELYPKVSKDLVGRRDALAPDIHHAFQSFQERVFADGVLPQKTSS